MKPYGVILTGPILKAAFRPSFLGGSTGNTRSGAIAGTTETGGEGCVPWAAGGGCPVCGEAAASGGPRDAETVSRAAPGAGVAEGCAVGAAAADKSAAFNTPLRLSASTRS